MGKEFNNIIFNYIQFVVFNNYLHFSNNSDMNIVSDITLWTFFGLSPHPNADGSISYIHDILYDDNSNNNNNTIRMLSNNSTLINTSEVDDLSEWFDENAFIITMSILFIIFFMISLFFLFKKLYNTFECLQVFGINNEEGVLTIRDGSIINIDKIKWKLSYHNFMIKMLLIAYCNLSTITISQLTRIEYSPFSISFVSIVVFFVLVIGFPVFIINTLYNNQDNLYRKECIDKYGSLYLTFKNTPKHNRFIIIILIKQLLYAIIININESLNYYQNTLLLLVNISFLIILNHYKPYVQFWTQVQAYILSIFMIIITLVNFIFITEGIGDSIKIVFYISSLIIHILSVFLFLTIQLMKYIEKKRQPEIQTFNIENDGIELLADNDYDDIVHNDNNVDYVLDINYQKETSERFAHEIEKNLTNIY